MDKWLALLKSRRFWAAVGGVLAIAMNDTLGIPEEEVNQVVAIVVAWIIGNTFRRTGGDI